MNDQDRWHASIAIEIVSLVAAAVSFFALKSPMSDVLLGIFVLGGMWLSARIYRSCG